jgi:hypothetical protein
MRIPRMTIRHVMIVVAIIALDLGYLQGGININLLVAVPVLQLRIFHLVSPRGTIRPFWVGFEILGWAGVIVFLLGAGELWFCFLDQQLNDAVTKIEHTRPGVAKAIATVLLCEGTPIKDTLPGLLPESMIAGMPILILALFGGLFAAWPVLRLDRLRPSSSVVDEL